MAIAFRPPEISSGAVYPANTTTNPSSQGVHYTTTSSAAQTHVVHHQAQYGVTPGGYLILSPSSAVIQHHGGGLWVSPQSAVQPQQMFSGFPPIYHNTTVAAAPQFHRVAYPTAQTVPQPMRTPQREVPSQRCVTTQTTGCCTTCNEDNIRRGK